jgi:hypothetical protein
VAFVQIIQYRTSKVDEVRRVHDEWAEADAGGATQRALMCEDRDNPGQYFDLAFFASYEVAMEHSESPVTQQFAQRMMALTDGPPTFYNLDVVEDRQLG